MSMRNRMGNAKNHYQGSAKKVLCVCSAGLLRSPTAAVVLSQEPYNFNTRAAGITNEYALIPVDEALIHWADEIVLMQPEHLHELTRRFVDQLEGKDLIVLNIPDSFEYRSPGLIAGIRKSYDASQAP